MDFKNVNIEIGMNSQRENIPFEIVDAEDYTIFKDLSISLLEEEWKIIIKSK